MGYYVYIYNMIYIYIYDIYIYIYIIINKYPHVMIMAIKASTWGRIIRNIYLGIFMG